MRITGEPVAPATMNAGTVTIAVSITSLRLRGAHQTGRPEPPSQPAAGDIGHPEFGKLRLVLPDAPDVDDSHPAAGAQHADRFGDRFLPAGAAADVVER